MAGDVIVVYPGFGPQNIGPEGNVEFGPATQGGQGAGAGGRADAWDPSGGGGSSSGFVISGGHVNQDPSSGGAGITGALASHYYQGYWAGVQGAMYAPPGPLPSAPTPYPIPGYGPAEPFPIPRFEPPEPGVIGTITAAIGMALAPPAEASPRDFSRIPQSLLPVGEGGAPGGGSPVPQDMFAGEWTGSNPRPPVPTLEQLRAEEARANEIPGPGFSPNWLGDFFMEMAEDPDFFPGGETSHTIRVGDDFFHANEFIGQSGRILGYSNNALPLFPVYKYMFGEGYPPLLMGRQGVALSKEFGIPIFAWGDIIPFE